MKTYINDQLSDAISTFEVLLNSEHKELFLDVLNSYVRSQNIDDLKLQRASRVMKSVVAD